MDINICLESLLGVGFLQEGAPELVIRGRVQHDELVPHWRQSVVHHHIQPAVMLPELRERQRVKTSRQLWKILTETNLEIMLQNVRVYP